MGSDLEMSEEEATTPDFAALYEPVGPEGWMVTPRMAYWLWSTALFLADTWRENANDPEAVADLLPSVARPHARGEWYERFGRCFDDLAERIATGEANDERLAKCTGDELALHLVIEHAEAHLNDGVIGLHIAAAQALPDHGDDDSDFDAMRDVLFEDHDVLMLYNPALDGIEDPTSGLSDQTRTTNLHPRDWFEPFAQH